MAKLDCMEDMVPCLAANTLRKLGRKAEAGAEMAQYHGPARMRSAHSGDLAQKWVSSGRETQSHPFDLEPVFSASRQAPYLFCCQPHAIASPQVGLCNQPERGRFFAF